MNGLSSFLDETSGSGHAELAIDIVELVPLTPMFQLLMAAQPGYLPVELGDELLDKSKRDDGTFSREDFIFDKERDIYTCPAGKTLTTTRKVVNDGQLLYRASKLDCDVCPFKMRCCPKEPARKIPRSIYDEARDIARALAKTEAFEQSRHDRKRVEMLFAHLKRILKLSRLRPRGPRGAQDEFTLAAIAQNLRRLAKLAAQPPPIVAVYVG